MCPLAHRLFVCTHDGDEGGLALIVSVTPDNPRREMLNDAWGFPEPIEVGST